MVGRSALRNRHHANRSWTSTVPSASANVGRFNDRKRYESLVFELEIRYIRLG